VTVTFVYMAECQNLALGVNRNRDGEHESGTCRD
jgi:hypothetical protein